MPLLILLIIAIGIFLSPVIGLLGQINWGGLFSLVQEASFGRSLYITLLSSFMASLISVVIGVLFARPFALYTWSGQRFQRLMLLIPYLVPNFVLAMAFVIAWNPTSGLLNKYISFPGGLYGLKGMITLFAITHIPVAFLLLEEKIKRIDPSLREAAKLSGASLAQIFFKIEIPLLLPSILSALSLCFALNISAFAIPAWIGAPERVYPLTYKIYQSIQLGGLGGIGEAAGISLCLLFFALIPWALGFILKGNDKKYALISGKSSKLSYEPLSNKSKMIFQFIFMTTQILFWIAPLACLFITTIIKPGCLQTGSLSQCLSEVTLSRYHYVIFELADSRNALKGSLIYGSLSSAIIVALGVFSLILFSAKPKFLNSLETVYAIPLATPGAIIALGLIVVASGRYGINLYNTAWIAVAAYVIKHTSLAFQPLVAGFKNISGSLSEAARLSGASQLQTWKRITLPLLKPEILGGTFLVFIPIVGELTMSVFLASPMFKSIGTVLFDLQDYADQASAGALAILLVILILMLNKLSRILSKGRLGY